MTGTFPCWSPPQCWHSGSWPAQVETMFVDGTKSWSPQLRAPRSWVSRQEPRRDPVWCCPTRSCRWWLRGRGGCHYPWWWPAQLLLNWTWSQVTWKLVFLAWYFWTVFSDWRMKREARPTVMHPLTKPWDVETIKWLSLGTGHPQCEIVRHVPLAPVRAMHHQSRLCLLWWFLQQRSQFSSAKYINKANMWFCLTWLKNCRKFRICQVSNNS